mmetsp:Transcript_10189/g.30383  ORF Transcript_10189/g.30383 Transcript_10189/m.30383 type:complete len:325 (-) Transcript_10189:108-1082(-)
MVVKVPEVTCEPRYESCCAPSTCWRISSWRAPPVISASSSAPSLSWCAIGTRSTVPSGPGRSTSRVEGRSAAETNGLFCTWRTPSSAKLYCDQLRGYGSAKRVRPGTRAQKGGSCENSPGGVPESEKKRPRSLVLGASNGESSTSSTSIVRSEQSSRDRPASQSAIAVASVIASPELSVYAPSTPRNPTRSSSAPSAPSPPPSASPPLVQVPRSAQATRRSRRTPKSCVPPGMHSSTSLWMWSAAQYSNGFCSSSGTGSKFLAAGEVTVRSSASRSSVGDEARPAAADEAALTSPTSTSLSKRGKRARRTRAPGGDGGGFGRQQ